MVCKGYHPSIKMPGRKIRPLYKKSNSPSDLCFSNQAGFPLERLITVRLRRPSCCVCVHACVSPSNIRKIKAVISVHKASDQTSSEVCDRRFKHFMDHWCWQVDHTGLKQMFSAKMNVWDLKRTAFCHWATALCEVLNVAKENPSSKGGEKVTNKLPLIKEISNFLLLSRFETA